MAAGLSAYRDLLTDPRARAFSAAGFVARMPLSMAGLGVVLLVSSTTGSFGRAGLITGVATLAGACTAPGWGRLIDRVGQARVLVAAAVINNLSLALLIATVMLELPLVVTLITAVGVGLGFSSAGSCVRARWTHRLSGSPLLNTANAWEAVIDEVVFIVGPVLVTFLATAIHPALGVASCIVLGLPGALALASMRDTEPPVGAHRGPQLPRTRMWFLIPIVAACGALGAIFGAMEVVVVAFAKAAGVLAATGFIVMTWAVGSLIAGVIVGTVSWKASPSRRFRIAAVLLAASLLPLPFVASPLLMAGLLFLSGFAIAPTLIASLAVTQSRVPARRLTEALGWTSTGLAAGIAAGAAASGQLIDLYGPTGGFWGLVGLGGVLVLSAGFVRAPRSGPPLRAGEPDTPPAVRPQPAAETPLR